VLSLDHLQGGQARVISNQYPILFPAYLNNIDVLLKLRSERNVIHKSIGRSLQHDVFSNKRNSIRLLLCITLCSFQTKMKYNRNNIGQFTKSFIRKLGIYTKRTILVSGMLTIIGYGYYAGTATKMATADSKVIYIQSTSTPAVLQRIEKCESGNSHIDKNGQVAIHVNTDKSYDIGIFQINSVWSAQATKLGYDLTNKEDNEAFATWLYENQGTGAWSASAKCWQ
jgi:hypothetical protein